MPAILTFLLGPVGRWLPFALAASAVVWGLFAWSKHQGAEHEREKQRAAQLESFRRDALRANSLALDLEQQLAKMRAANDQLTEELKDETNRDPVYRECVVPADGLRLYNASRQGAPSR